MNNKQTQVEIEDELVAVRVLSAIFITFMVLIIGSYSDIPKDEIAQNTTTHSVAQSSTKNITSSNQLLRVKSQINSELLR